MKKLLFSLLCIILIVMCMSGCGKKQTEARCTTCDRYKMCTEYKNSNGTYYLCESCTTYCRVCQRKAETHYTNSQGIEVFVCNNCYDNIKHNR